MKLKFHGFKMRPEFRMFYPYKGVFCKICPGVYQFELFGFRLLIWTLHHP